MKKVLSLFVTVILASMLLIGCSKGAKTEEETTDTSENVTNETQDQEEENQEDGDEVLDGENVTLSVMCHSSWLNDAAKSAFDFVSEKYNVKFEFEEVPEGTSGEELILARMQSGEVPDILWWQGANALESNIGIEEFVELSGDWTNDYSDFILESASQSVNEKIYCTPFGDLTTFGIIYNKQVFADNNVEVPNSWDEFISACETFSQAGITPVFTSATTDNEWT